MGLLHWQVDSLPLSLLEIRRWLGLHLKLPWKVKVKVAQSCPTLWTISPWNSLGQNTGVGSLTLLQGIFPTLGSEGPPRDERSVGLRARVQESEVPAGDWGCVCRAPGGFGSVAERRVCWAQGTPLQGSNPGLPHCRQFLYQLSHEGSPRILEWVAFPFSSGSTLQKSGLLQCSRILYQLSYQGSCMSIKSQ